MFQKKNPKNLALNISSNVLSCKNSYKKPKVTHESAPSAYHAGPVRILPNLYLGAAHNAQDLYQLKRYAISTIINVASEVIKPAVIPFNIDYHHIRWTHNQDNLASLEFGRAIDLIKGAHSKNHVVLVHCQQGIERSAALIIAYLIHMSRHQPHLLSSEQQQITSQSLAGKNWSLDDAMTFVKERAHGIRPNLSEMYQLHEYDKALPLSGTLQRPSIQTRTRRSESIATCEPTFINPIKPLTMDPHYGRPRATSFRDVSHSSSIIASPQPDKDKLAAAAALIVLFAICHKEKPTHLTF